MVPPSSLIVSTTSGILKDYPLLHSHRERKRRERERERERERRANHLFSPLRSRNNRMDRETPAREIDTRTSVENHAATSLTSDVRSPLASMWRRVARVPERSSSYARFSLVSLRHFQWFDKLCRCEARVRSIRVRGKGRGEREREEDCGKWWLVQWDIFSEVAATIHGFEGRCCGFRGN